MSLRHRVEYLAYRATRAKWSVLPEAGAASAGAMTGTLAGSVLRIRRSAVDENLRLAFPEQSESWWARVAQDSYRHLGREVAAVFRMSRWGPDEIMRRVRFENFDAVDEAMARGQGAVLMTAHLGNWEIAGAALAARGFPIDVVGKGMSNRAVEADLFRIRERLGMSVIPMAEAPRRTLGALGEGRMVALLGDQNAHRGGVFVDFFGRPAATPRGPALFAIRKEVPIFCGFALRDPSGDPRYTLRAHTVHVERSGDLDADVIRVLTAYHDLLEQAIRGAPEQYFWQHRRWKTRPPEEQGASG
ncbi:MAG: lysophospholipid acyltransferase family protein [Gemmatimonadota bacterium]